MNDLWNLNIKFNSTALIYVAGEGYKDIVELLLRQEGIDINMKDVLNRQHFWYSNPTFLTPLKFWMIYGIWKKKFCKAAIDHARKRNHREIVDLLSKMPIKAS